MTMKAIEVHSEQIDAVCRRAATQRNVAGRVAELLKGKDLEKFKECLVYAYSPYIRFGIRIGAKERGILMSKVNYDETIPTLDITDREVWEELDYLRGSTDSSGTKFARLERFFSRLGLQTGHIFVAILEKSLIMGVQASTVNKAFPDLVPSFGVQLAAKYTDRKVKSYPVYVEPKYDGMRATAIIHPTGDVEVMTRKGLPITAATYFHPALREVGERYRQACLSAGIEYKGCVLDGELLGGTFNNTISIFRSGTVATEGIFQVFDFLPMKALTEPASPALTYELRRNALLTMVQENDMLKVSPAMKASNATEVWAMYEKARAQGLEGIIVKDPNGLWETKRTNAWLKVKAEETEDLTIIGAFEGEGAMQGTLGGLIVDRNGVQVRVGSGFTAEDRDALWTDFLDDLLENETGGDQFKLIGYTCEVQYQEVTKDGSLRHPVFVRMRKDKDEALF